MNQDQIKLKYFIYARKSSESEDRQMASIESQIDELKKLAQQEGLEVVRIFSEAKSAKAPGRPIFNEMLAEIHKGEVKGILCWKLNRLARNPIDGGQISWMIQQSIIGHIQTYGRSYYPSDNVLVMSVELGIANQFIRDLSIDTKRGLRSKAERGWYPTYTTLGYMHNPLKRKGEKEVIKDPERFELVKKAFDLMLTGAYTPPKILDIANNEWGLRTKAGRKVARSTIYRIFSDPFYYGEYEFPKGSGIWYHGSHEAMITKDEYNKIQDILGKSGKQKPHTKYFPFTGLMSCGECGAMITAEIKVKNQKNGNVHTYVYYHCTKRKNPKCSQGSILAAKLEEQISDVLSAIQIPSEFKEWAMEILRCDNEKEFKAREIIIASHRRGFDNAIKKLDRLIDMRAAGEINEDEFLRSRSEVLREKERFQKLIEDSNKRVDDWLKEAEHLFAFAELAKFRFENGTDEVKRGILSELGSNLILKDKKLSINLPKVLQEVKKIAPEVNDVSDKVRTSKNLVTVEDFRDNYSKSPNLLRW